jgi:excisionase family DNA binding protein
MTVAKTRGAARPATALQLEGLAEAAARLGVHPRTIRRHIASGSLTGYRLGSRLIRVDASEVDALLRPIPTAAHRPA